MEMLGIEPRTSYMQSMRSTTELHPQPDTKAILISIRWLLSKGAVERKASAFRALHESVQRPAASAESYSRVLY